MTIDGRYSLNISVNYSLGEYEQALDAIINEGNDDKEKPHLKSHRYTMIQMRLLLLTKLPNYSTATVNNFIIINPEKYRGIKPLRFGTFFIVFLF